MQFTVVPFAKKDAAPVVFATKTCTELGDKAITPVSPVLELFTQTPVAEFCDKAARLNKKAPPHVPFVVSTITAFTVVVFPIV